MRMRVALLVLVSLYLDLGGHSQKSPNAGSTSNRYYDGAIRVTPPPEWVEKRAWDLMRPGTTSPDLPFYRPDLLAAAFIGSRDPVPGSPGEMKTVRIEEGLSVLTYYWPSEAGRFYAALGQTTVSTEKPGSLVIGESYGPGDQNYLGERAINEEKVELTEWVAKGALDEAFVREHKLPEEFIGRRLQCILGEGRFGGRTSGYIVAACRFVKSEHGLEWIMPLLSRIELVPDSEKAEAEKASRVRELIMGASDEVHSEEFADANSKLEDALKLAPEDENAMSLRAVLLLHGNKLPQAEALLSKAIAVDPDHEYARYYLGRVLCARGKKDEARTQFDALARITVLHPKAGCN